MNENLNLVEILKDCPSGTKLYSTVFGEVKLKEVGNTEYPILLETMTGLIKFKIAQDGRYFSDFNGECTLFPSKEQKDWSKFNPKKKELVSPYEFKNGDIVATNTKLQVFILQRAESDKKGYCYIGYDFKLNVLFLAGKWRFDRLATEEEKQKLFDAIKLNGYKWNPEIKTLEKLVKPKFKVGDKITNVPRKYMGACGITGTILKITDDKYVFTNGSHVCISNQGKWELVQDKFDPKTLQPFDKVLVRDAEGELWRCAFYSHKRESDNKYATTNYWGFRCCIPYNEDTKHLAITTQEAPEFYRHWEE